MEEIVLSHLADEYMKTSTLVQLTNLDKKTLNSILYKLKKQNKILLQTADGGTCPMWKLATNSDPDSEADDIEELILFCLTDAQGMAVSTTDLIQGTQCSRAELNPVLYRMKQQNKVIYESDSGKNPRWKLT